MNTQTFTFPDADFCLRARGDSMAFARIFDGDIVFVTNDTEANNGDFTVIANPEGDAEMRIYFNVNGKVSLMSADPRIPPIVYREEEPKATIIGKVVGFYSVPRFDVVRRWES